MVQIVKGTVDTQKNNCQSIGRANAGDDLKLELEIQMNGQPITFVNPTFELLIKKADNNKVRQTKDIIYQDGKIKIKVDQQGVTCPGTVINQLIINDEGKISTCLFYFTVGASLEKEILQSISKVETLEQLDSYVVAAFSNLDEYEKRLTLLDSTMTTTNEEITANESERKSNESERKDNETLRIENEKERVKKENEMSAAEIDRKENELDRIKNENARRIAENTRIARENARENAEINRNAIFEENEAIRTEAEKLRVQAEIKRKESFSNLESLNEKLNAAEENRVNSEEYRISKETERQLAEAERERAEANREKTYTSFNNAEVDRKNSEDARIQAEASRVQAENARSEQFEAAQSARETKFQEVENNRDKLFKANETARTTEEIARKKAESTREGNETIRVNSESLRVAAEKARQQEEIKRGQAEVARVEAEKSRELSYEAIKKDNSTFKQQMNEDFGNAKTDYFGKEHLNVVDRLNVDFDNVHQRINDANYLEYNGSNITADNSYYGYAKELSIKGITCQNLITFTSKIYNDSYPRVYFKRNIDLKPNTTYTFITPSFDSSKHSMYIGFNGGKQLLNYQKKHIGTFTTSADMKNVESGIFFFYSGNAQSFVETCPTTHMILEGDYTNVDLDIPCFEGIKSVGENDVTEEGKYPVKIKSYGKNLCDNIYEIGSFSATGEHDISSTRIRTVNYLNVNSNNIYICTEKIATLGLRFYDSSKKWINYNKAIYTNNSVCINVSIPPKAKFIRFSVVDVTDLNFKVYISDVPIDNYSSYVDYQGTMQELLLNEPLRSLPNGVCDEILEDGTEIRRVGKAILDGNKSWKATINQDGNSYRYSCNFKFKTSGNQDNINNIICSDLATKNYNDIYNNSEKGITTWWSNDYKTKTIVVCLNNKYSLEQFKEWLNNNPITVYYELTEPVITKHNKNMNLKTYDGTTHITSTNVLPATISCKVPSNVQAVISNLKEENKALNTQVSTLNLENVDIKETNANQDELINTTMMATDQMYMMLEPLLANMLVDGEAISPLVNMYAAMVQRGLKTIEQVPEKWRAQVEEILSESNE